MTSRTPSRGNASAANFQPVEDEALISAIETHKDLINAAFSGTVTFSKKTKAWKNITDRVNAVGGNEREVAKVKKRWEDLKRRAKEVHAGQRQAQGRTGGGASNAPLDLLHMDRIVAIAGLTTMEGIDGGVDSDYIREFGLSKTAGFEEEGVTADHDSEPKDDDSSPTLQLKEGSTENSAEDTQARSLSSSPLSPSPAQTTSAITPQQKTAIQASCSNWSSKKGKGKRKSKEAQIEGLDAEPKAFHSDQQERIVQIERERLELAKQKLALLESSHTLQEKMVGTLDGILEELKRPHSTFGKGERVVAYDLGLVLPVGSTDEDAALEIEQHIELTEEPAGNYIDVKPPGSDTVGRPDSPTASVMCGTSENTETARPDSPTLSVYCGTSQNT